MKYIFVNPLTPPDAASIIGSVLTTNQPEKQMRSRRGFTLIELMVVVAIIGILAAVAFPAYQDYATRSKVSELILAIDGCKTSVTEYYQSQAAFPSDQNASGCGDQQTRYVQTLVVGQNGTITATAKTGSGALDIAAAGDVQFVPTVTATGQLTWACNGAGTTIPAKYLPALCRG